MQKLSFIKQAHAEHGNPHWLLAVHLLFMQMCLVLGFLYLNWGAEPFIYPACLLFLLLCIWMFVSWRLLTGHLFSPYPLFLASAVLFNGGQLLLEVFGLNPEGILNGQFTPEALFRTIWFILLGLAAFHAGALCSVMFRSSRTRSVSPVTAVSEKDVLIVGWFLFLIAVIPASMLLKDAVTAVLSSNYLALYGNDDPTGFQAAPTLIGKFLIPSALFILAGSQKKRLMIGLSFAIVLVFTLTMLVVGVRSTAIMPLAAYAWMYDRYVKKIPRALISIIGCASFFIIFPLVSITRLASRSSIDLAGSLTQLDNPFLAIVNEVGNSMLTVAHTMDLVPLVRNFDYGIGYAYAIFTVVPNLFWDLHPTIARGVAADWLRWQIDPAYAQIGGGYGYSFIAEAFLNFGWYGLLFLGALGFGLGRLVRYSEADNEPAKLAMLASFLSFFLVFARDETASMIRPLLWYSILPYWGVYLVRMIRRRK